MMKYVLLLIVATLAAAVFALADVVGKVDNTAHAQAGTPSNVSAANGANPGEAVVSWDACGRGVGVPRGLAGRGRLSG